MTKFILLRHGQTDWNIQRLYQGQEDIPLNDNGKRQAEEAAETLKNVPIDIAYCSDLQRAVETAKTVLRYHPSVPLMIDKRIRERSFGEYEGKPYQKDLMNPTDSNETNKKRDSLNFKFPQGESLLDVYERANSFYNDILQKHPNETVLIVSHGTFLSILSAIIYQDELAERKKYIFNNAEPVFIDPTEYN